jgi:dihydrofolate reductase
MITLIAAVARNGVIGSNNALPWQLPEDMKHFRQLTTGNVVIMGRKTWESLPERFRPLPDRMNVVVTRNAAYAAPGATIVHTLDEALKVGVTEGSPLLGTSRTAFIIGGAELYAHALQKAERLELTEIAAEYPGDAHFPDIDRTQWHEVCRQAGQSSVGLGYAFVTYERTQST